MNETVVKDTLLESSFPDLLWELETHLGINYGSSSREDFIRLGDDKTPYSKITNALTYFHLYSKEGDVHNLMYEILQNIIPISMRIAHLGMHANAYKSMILIPSKDNYQGLGKDEFMKLINTLINSNLCKRRDISDGISKKLEHILDSPNLKGVILNLELRVLMIIFVLLRMLTDSQTASFLAQFILIQENISSTQ